MTARSAPRPPWCRRGRGRRRRWRCCRPCRWADRRRDRAVGERRPVGRARASRSPQLCRRCSSENVTVAVASASRPDNRVGDRRLLGVADQAVADRDRGAANSAVVSTWSRSPAPLAVLPAVSVADDRGRDRAVGERRQVDRGRPSPQRRHRGPLPSVNVTVAVASASRPDNRVGDRRLLGVADQAVADRDRQVGATSAVVSTWSRSPAPLAVLPAVSVAEIEAVIGPSASVDRWPRRRAARNMRPVAVGERHRRRGVGVEAGQPCRRPPSSRRC